MTGLWLVQTAAEQLARARAGLDTPLPERLLGIVGIATMLAIAYLISYDRKRISWRMVGAGVLLQSLFGVIVLKTGVGRAMFVGANDLVVRLLSFQEQGARFVFGNLVQNEVPLGGGATPQPQAGGINPETVPRLVGRQSVVGYHWQQKLYPLVLLSGVLIMPHSPAV